MNTNERLPHSYTETTTNTTYDQPTLRFGTRVVSVKLHRSFSHYKANAAALIGIIQVLLGLLSIALGISQPLVFSTYGHTAFGIWCGVAFIIAGLLGIISNKKRTPEWIVAHMVFSILAATLAGLMFALSVFAAFMDNKLSKNNKGSVLSVDCLLAITAFFEAVAAISAASISCNVTCCNNNFHASQKEVDNPNVLSYQVNDNNKYVINPQSY